MHQTDKIDSYYAFEYFQFKDIKKSQQLMVLTSFMIKYFIVFHTIQLFIQVYDQIQVFVVKEHFEFIDTSFIFEKKFRR